MGCRPAGTRPVLIEGFWHALRTSIAGRAEVNGWRGDTGPRAESVQTWPLRFDVRVLWLTLVKGFGRGDAC